MQLANGVMFCEECGTPVASKKSCVKCGYEFERPGKFCPKCGTKRERTLYKNKFDSTLVALWLSFYKKLF